MNRRYLTLNITTGIFILHVFSFLSCKQKQADATLYVDTTIIEGEITPWLYGACIEDVNHEIYGGLYDQKIFGESFEEPAPNPTIDNFSIYEGIWNVEQNEISVLAHPGAKLVYDPVKINKGTIETEVKFEKEGGDNAGLLVRVSEPGNGADNFIGYEISLSADGTRMILGKHKKNFEPIRDIAVNCDATVWNKLKVTMDEVSMEIFLNDKSLLVYADNDASFTDGKIALRTWNSNVRFRNIVLSVADKSKTLSFKTETAVQVSSQWKTLLTGNVKAVFTLDERTAYSGKNSQMLRFLSGSGCLGVSNAGLNGWGIAVEKEQKFQGSLYLKGSGHKGSVYVALQSADGKNEYAVQEINTITDGWEKYPFKLTSDTQDDKARFAVYMKSPGQLWIDQVILMTTGDKQFKGLPLRNDVAQAMVDQGLTFLRYGGTMINTSGYRFKKMIGNRDKRPPYRGHWYPYSTNGFGIEDFIQFCEVAGFTPSFAVNIEETPEDMADMVEYLNGPVSTEWGRKRAENGHPQPYNIKYIGIGNEEVLFNGDKAEEYNHYIERFKLLYNAMKSKDPSISLINTAWWRPGSPNMEKVFKALDGKADYWDYHPWADGLSAGKEVETTLKQMKELFQQWNPDTKMRCAIFEENGNTHNIQRALGHVTVQNAVRKMGDFVLTSCAANALQPYQQNDNGWDQGQIFFTPSKVWGMPPYYAQQMASLYHQPLLIESRLDGFSDQLDITATRSREGNELVMHVVNTGDILLSVKLHLNGFEKIYNARSVTLSGGLTDVNTPEEPEKIIPRKKEINHSNKLTYQFEPYSYTVLLFSR